MTQDTDTLIKELRDIIEKGQSVKALNGLNTSDTEALFRGFTDWCKRNNISVPMDEDTFVEEVCRYLGLNVAYESHKTPNGDVIKRIFTQSEV